MGNIETYKHQHNFLLYPLEIFPFQMSNTSFSKYKLTKCFQHTHTLLLLYRCWTYNIKLETAFSNTKSNFKLKNPHICSIMQIKEA